MKCIGRCLLFLLPYNADDDCTECAGLFHEWTPKLNKIFYSCCVCTFFFKKRFLQPTKMNSAQWKNVKFTFHEVRIHPSVIASFLFSKRSEFYVWAEICKWIVNLQFLCWWNICMSLFTAADVVLWVVGVSRSDYEIMVGGSDYTEITHWMLKNSLTFKFTPERSCLVKVSSKFFFATTIHHRLWTP